MDIYATLYADAKNLHYAKRYKNYITACIRKNKISDAESYTERHHILPRNLYPQFKSFSQFPDNCAVLTYRQHIIAHWMLWKIFDDIRQAMSFFMMCNMETKIPSRENTYTYRKAREMFSQRTDMNGFCTYSDVHGKKYWVRTDDPRVVSGELIHHQKNKGYYKDSNGNTYWLSTTHPDVLSGKVVSLLLGVPKSTLGRKNIVDGINKTGFPAKNALTGENLGRIPTSDNRWKTGEIVCLGKGQAVYKDIVGNVIRSSTNDPRVLSGDLISINIGKVTVKNSNNQMFRVDINDPRINTGEYSYITSGVGVYQNNFGEIRQLKTNDDLVTSGEFYSIARGKSLYVDKCGNRHYVSNQDSRVASGELVSIKTGSSIYKNSEGKIVHLNMDDPRVLSGEYVGHTKGKAVFKDKNGNKFVLYVNDPRVISGEFVGTHSGRIVPDDEKIRRREAMILAGRQAKLSSDGTPIGKIPLNDIRWSTGEIVSLRKRLPGVTAR